MTLDPHSAPNAEAFADDLLDVLNGAMDKLLDAAEATEESVAQNHLALAKVELAAIARAIEVYLVTHVDDVV